MENDVIDEMFEIPLPKLSSEVRRKIHKPSDITSISKNNINELITDSAIQDEIGFRKSDNGNYLIAMNLDMPDITSDMIEWWFWWYSQNSLLYRLWYPGSHSNILNIEDKVFKGNFHGFKPCTHRVVEDFGHGNMELAIKFRNPEYFGFNRELFNENEIGTVISATVGSISGNIGHSDMVHVFKEKEDGLQIISRFWIGKNLPLILKRRFINDDTAYLLSKHCFIEYTRLSEILPKLYDAYREKIYKIEIGD
ncbi:MAG: hypothetical protein K1X33_04905 [Methanobacteriaceae archaeon]|nr:hypothetical protein [Methanobacteriaceae archaeon]